MGDKHTLTIAEMRPDPALCPELMLSGHSEFPSGTRMYFDQEAAPPHWMPVKITPLGLLCEKL